jgi:hypothetical protein
VYPDDLNYRRKESLPTKGTEHIAVEVYVTFNDNKKMINIEEAHAKTETR